MPGYYEQQPPPVFQDPRVIRSVGRCILLLIVSGGFWGIAWMYHTTKEVSSKVNNPAPGATFRHTARELLALSAWRANDAAATRQWLDMIANDGETPPSLRSRAEALQALLPPVAKS